MDQTQLINETYELVKTNQKNYPLTDVVRRFNLALDEYFSIVTNAYMRGTYVDRNVTGIPSETISLVDGQNTYALSAQNIVRVLYVRAEDKNGNPYILYTNSQRVMPRASRFLTAQPNNLTGRLMDYEVFGNQIHFDVAPDYDRADAVTVYYLTTADYFADDGSDTDKIPGINPLHYNYLPLYAAYKYAIPNRPSLAEKLKRDMMDERKRIVDDQRNDTGKRNRLYARQINSR